MNLLLKNKSV